MIWKNRNKRILVINPAIRIPAISFIKINPIMLKRKRKKKKKKKSTIGMFRKTIEIINEGGNLKKIKLSIRPEKIASSPKVSRSFFLFMHVV